MSAVRDLLESPLPASNPSPAAPAPGAITPNDLAELLARFEDATRALQGTHETLQSEVQRLEGELRETKGQLRRAQDLAALGEMAAGIAHEIRNPLGSIRLYAGALVEDLEDRPNEKTLASKVVRAVDSLNAVVCDVLAFSREIRMNPESVDIQALFSHALDSCAAVIAATKADVQIDVGEPIDVVCDPSLVHQALVNVVRNACEAAAEVTDSPRITLSTRVRTMLGGDGRRVAMRALRVTDNGPGVPPEVRARMFNPFFTTRHTGTGLGLAIVHRLLDAHDGRIDIQDNDDALGTESRGAIVDLLIPEHMHPSANGETP